MKQANPYYGFKKLEYNMRHGIENAPPNVPERTAMNKKFEKWMEYNFGPKWKQCNNYPLESMKEAWNAALESKVDIHGTNCKKSIHLGDGYLHHQDHDGSYIVDGSVYCGRCHTAI